MQGDLIDDGGAIDQPANGPHIGPSERRIVEDGGILGLAGVQGGDHPVTTGAQGFRRTVKVQAVATLVLHLGQQDDLALQRRRPADPAALRLHADHFGVGVLGNLPN